MRDNKASSYGLAWPGFDYVQTVTAIVAVEHDGIDFLDT
jgi:hypothetical protein